MPYISQDRKNKLALVWQDYIASPGELNYVLTKVCIDYIEEKGVSYWVYNDVMGALECAKLEMYRRVVADYEDLKKEENGDVY